MGLGFSKKSKKGITSKQCMGVVSSKGLQPQISSAENCYCTVTGDNSIQSWR